MFPTIEIIPPPSWDPIDHALDGLYMYDGLIFTSTNGVEYFFKRMEDGKTSPQDLKSKMIFAVGEKTKQAIEQHGLKVTAVPEKFTAFDLQILLEHEDISGKTFLFPRGNLGDDQLSGNLRILGASVDSVIVYQTAKPKAETVENIRELIFNHKIDAITFTSPSTFKNFASLFSTQELHQLATHTKLAAIGPVTAKAIEDGGLEADIIAKNSSVESLVEAICSIGD